MTMPPKKPVNPDPKTSDDIPKTGAKRGPRASKVKASALESAIAAIGNIPEKQQEYFSLRQAIAQLLPQISSALDKGYSIEEVVDYLSKDGIIIQPSTLRSYLVAARRATGKKGKSTRKRNVEP
jgi:hypothetical protein